jgi:DNA uptake protein ComE-like DNA-binding protein
VNTAAAEDLAVILQLSEAQAQAIIARRTKKKFESLDDLKSVRDIDAAKIEAKAAYLVFQ